MTTLRLRHAFAGALAVCLLALGATDAHATHFRYGTLRWEKLSEDANNVTIKVTTESAWRLSYPAWPSTPTIGVPMGTGQTLTVQRIVGGGAVFSTPLVITPSAINGAEDWFVGSGEHTITFLKSNLPVRIFWQGTARISTLVDGNNDRDFRVESVMTATANAASPAASILPIITIGYPLPAAHFFIPAADVEGDTLTWSISPLARSLLIKAAPDGSDNNPTPANFTINPATGEVTWATNQELAPVPGPPNDELFAVQFIVRDNKGGETPVDALLRLIPNVGTPPEARINGLTTEHVVAVRPNNPVTFTLTGIDVDPGATVTLTSGALPPGSSMTPSLPTSGTGAAPGTSSVFNWTPTIGQAGNVFVVSFAVTDNFGIQSTNSARITVLENFAPVVVCPVPTAVEATAPTGASATIEATVSDPDQDAMTVKWFVDGTLVETDLVPAGVPSQVVNLTHAYALGLHAIRVEVDDGQLTRECTSSVEVVDTTAPVLTLPADITLEATSPAGAVATFVATALDIVDGNVPVTCVPPSGSTFPLGVNTVNCTATDSHGNTASGSFRVTVVDTTPPTIHNMPPDMTVPATSPTGAIVTWPPPNATDIVDVTVPVICVPPSGSFFPLGTTTVNCTATDRAGNSASASFKVTVVDLTPPVVTVTLNPGVLWPPNHKMVDIAVTVTTSDTDPNPVCLITSVTSNEPIDGTGDGDTAPDWEFSGLTLQLRAERAGNRPRGTGRIYTVTVSCTDRDGNTGTGTATARVPHDMSGPR